MGWLLALLLGAFTLVWVPGAAAQGEAQAIVKRLQVQVLPEYDDPRVLVIVQGRLGVTAEELPLTLTVRVPRGAQINQMAVMDMTSGRTASKTYEAVPDPADERWSLVTYTVDNAHFFYEYYYNPLEGDPDKRFSFTFSTALVVEDLMVEVQQPLAATAFSAVPAPTVARSDDKGFTYHQFTVGALPAGGETSIEVRYTKSDPNPSLSREQLLAQRQTEMMTGESAALIAAQPTSAPETPLWVWALLGGGMIVGGAVLWQRQRTPVRASVALVERAAEVVRFCPTCGAEFKVDARFCHRCGAPRQEMR